VRAVLESIAYQTRDVVECVRADSGLELDTLRVDGGAAINDFLMQFQADILGVRVERPPELEASAFGVALLAGLGVGFWSDRSDLESADERVQVFEPKLGAERREALYAGWKRAVERSRDWEEA
jgi:glycerol kinase